LYKGDWIKKSNYFFLNLKKLKLCLKDYGSI
jgi:hypothetical protein